MGYLVLSDGILDVVTLELLSMPDPGDDGQRFTLKRARHLGGALHLARAVGA